MQLWLRDPTKRWSRFRLATGCAFTTISAGALAISRISGFLSECHPDVDDETGIARAVMEDYLSWLVTKGYSASTRALSLSMIRVFFDACHRHGWLARTGRQRRHLRRELSYHHDQGERFVPEFEMSQLESDAALHRLPNPTTRNLVVGMIETRSTGRRRLHPRVQPRCSTKAPAGRACVSTPARSAPSN